MLRSCIMYIIYVLHTCNIQRSVLLSVTRLLRSVNIDRLRETELPATNVFAWTNLLQTKYLLYKFSMSVLSWIKISPKKRTYQGYSVSVRNFFHDGDTEQLSVCIFSFLVINSLFGDEITVKQSDICRCFWHKCFFTTSSGLEESNHVKSDFYAAILKLNKSIWKRLWMIDWLLRCCCRCGKTVWSKNNQTETMSSYPTTTKPDLFLQAQPCLLHLESLTIGDFTQRTGSPARGTCTPTRTRSGPSSTIPSGERTS